MPDFIIDDRTPSSILFPAAHGRGAVPRDFAVDPPEMFQDPSGLTLIPRSEWDDRIAEQEAEQSSLEHVRLRGNNGQPIPSLDQGSWGYCWAHSTTNTVVLSRANANQPYVPLSAFSVAATIKQGANEGGWCGLSAKFMRETGVASQAVWPQGDAHYKNYQTQAVKDDMALHKITEDWVDVAKPVYDQNLTFDQVATCMLLNIPCAVDFNWWSHSVCAIRLIRVSSGVYGLKIWNSWGDSWGDKGMGILTGSKMLPDGAVATRVTVAS